MTGAIFGEISKAVEGYFAWCLAHAILLALLMMWLSLSALAQLKKRVRCPVAETCHFAWQIWWSCRGDAGICLQKEGFQYLARMCHKRVLQGV